MGQLSAVMDFGTRATGARSSLRVFFVVEGLASTAASFLMVGIFFFTAHRFGWGLTQNFLLAAVQGIVYVLGALLAGRFAERWGRRTLLCSLYVGMALVASVAVWSMTPALVVAVLLGYTLLSAGAWPALESLVSSGAGAHELSRRLGIYNLVWSGTGAFAVAINGLVIKHFPAGVFLIPATIHVVCALLIRRGGDDGATDANGASHAQMHAKPEPALLAQRRLAMVLSRIVLPATYMLIYSVSALMPLLPAVKELDETTRTLAGSVWMMTRTLAFVALGATVFWHTRPKLLLVAAVLMLLSFGGIAVRPSDLFAGAGASRALDLAALIGAQALLGVTLGMIYCGSLYFGMVLSEGSTEHGGYHEALIGLGSVLGPGTGAAALVLWNGNVNAGLVGVAGIVAASVLAAGIAAVGASRKG